MESQRLIFDVLPQEPSTLLCETRSLTGRGSLASPRDLPTFHMDAGARTRGFVRMWQALSVRMWPAPPAPWNSERLLHRACTDL